LYPPAPRRHVGGTADQLVPNVERRRHEEGPYARGRRPGGSRPRRRPFALRLRDQVTDHVSRDIGRRDLGAVLRGGVDGRADAMAEHSNCL
jgi:hypothetical protein